METLIISPTLLWAVGIAAAIWLLTSFVVLPALRRRVRTADSAGAPARAGILAGVGVLRLVAGTALVAGLLTLLGGMFLRWRMQSLGSSPENLERILSLREGLEPVVETTQQISQFVWIAALLALGTIWFVLARSGSSRRWSQAIDKRKQAIRESLRGVSPDELKARAQELSPDGVAELEQRLASVNDANRSVMEAAAQMPVVQFGEDANAQASINDLRQLAASFEARAAEAKTATGADDAAERDKLLSAAASLQAKILEIENELVLPLATPSGHTEPVPLATFRARMNASSGEAGAEILELVVNERVKNHEIEANRKAQREPEMLGEWLATGATSEAAVATTSRVGQLGARVALLSIFLGLVGVSASSFGPGLLRDARTVELSVSAQRGEATLQEAIVNAAPPPVVLPDDEMASDDATVNYLRTNFRIAAARSIRNSIGDATFRTPSARRQLFDLSSVDARRAILRSSTRPAPPSLDSGRRAPGYESVHADPSLPERQSAQVLDEALDRRINQLRANEPAWNQMRRAAARPATTAHAADAFLRTALGSNQMASSHTLRSWANTATAEYTSSAVRGGNPAAGEVSSGLGEKAHMVSAREQRILQDFRAEAPQRVGTAAEAYRSGQLDPGSIHRPSPRSSANAARAGARVASVYARLFPATNTASSGRPRTSARSYSRVRFSGRVGGVVIGRDPEPGDVELDVVGLQWQQRGRSAVSLAVNTSDNRSINLGRFHPAIIHHAMAYAADGRVVTSTLPATNDEYSEIELLAAQLVQRGIPLEQALAYAQQEVGGELPVRISARQVAVHPAFEDTGFACPAIQVDRFVDSFMYDQAAPGPAVAARTAVTMLGQVLLEITDYPAAARLENLEALKPIYDYARECGTDDRCFPVQSYQAAGFDFDVMPLLQCFSRSDQLADCGEALTRVQPQAGYMVDSGVREMPFQIDTNFAFITGDARARANPLWPLEFIVQAVPQSLTGEDVEVGNDAQPWQFPYIAAHITDKVAAGIASDRRAQQVLDHMKQFVVLQRFFRLALDGKLGLNFPLGALVVLQDETRGAVTIRRNERWNYNDDFVEKLQQEEAFFFAQLNGMLEDDNLAPDCTRQIVNALELVAQQRWPSSTGMWPLLGRFEDTCGKPASAASLISRRDQLRDQELIDEAILFATRIKEDPSSCPAL